MNKEEIWEEMELIQGKTNVSFLILFNYFSNEELENLLKYIKEEYENGYIE